MKIRKEIKEKHRAYFIGDITLKYRGERIPETFRLLDYYDLDFYSVGILNTKSANEELYNQAQKFESSGKLNLRNVIIQKPENYDKTLAFTEDLSEAVIYTYESDSFTQSTVNYGVIRGRICFFIEYSETKSVYVDPTDKTARTLKDGIINSANKKSKPIYIKSAKPSKFLAKLIITIILLATFIPIFIVLYKVSILAFSVFLGAGILKLFIQISSLVRSFFRFLWHTILFTGAFSGLAFLSFFFANLNVTPSPISVEEIYTDSVKIENEVLENNLHTTLRWNDYKNNRFEADIELDSMFFKDSRKKRSNFISYNTNWAEIYTNLLSNDKNYMDKVFAAYERILQKKKLNQHQFADAIVTSIQTLPYVWILNKNCDLPDSKAKIAKSGYDCLGNIMLYAVQSPYEFIYNTKGDCDTRTVFLYSVLQHFGYDVRILISKHYQHSILGVNLPSSGKYLKSQTKKYYVWETTLAGMKLGQLNPEISNMNLWSIAL